ncbi:histone-like nucleoid-structuring protein Lsr2 [Streptomyces sp. NPDC008121]|uniref:Lsr2 dimerization domain-containing protein n=1 Tax=Streptomyces sp. NPDC008121 TaxID=3364809 RepID=UPI0036E7CFCB
MAGKTETVSFGIDGICYEAELDEGQALELREALTPFLRAARPETDTSPRGAERRRRPKSRKIVVPPVVEVAGHAHLGRGGAGGQDEG